MKHPFTKLFYNALKKSSLTDNVVLAEAEKLKGKGYSAVEIYGVLVPFGKGIIDPVEDEIVTEAIEEFSKYIEEESDKEE